MLIKSLADHTQNTVSHPKYLSKVLSQDGGTQLYPMSFLQALLNIWNKNRSLAFFDKLFNNDLSSLMNLVELSWLL